jgi:hypothetical protein
MITTIFLVLAVLSYPPLHVIISQAPVAVDRGCYFTSGSFCPIMRSVTTRGLISMVFGCWGCDNVACCLNPLLGQGNDWRVWWDHPLDLLHDCLESYCTEVWSYSKNCPSWAHHVDAAGFDGMVPTSTAPNLRVVFNGIPIRSCSR